MKDGGDGGIRTLDRALQPYNGLANRRLQPLGHVSSMADMPDAAAARKRRFCVPKRARAIGDSGFTGALNLNASHSPRRMACDRAYCGAYRISKSSCTARLRLEPASLSCNRVAICRLVCGIAGVMESPRRLFDSQRVECASEKACGTSCLRSDLGGK